MSPEPPPNFNSGRDIPQVVPTNPSTPARENPGESPVRPARAPESAQRPGGGTRRVANPRGTGVPRAPRPVRLLLLGGSARRRRLSGDEERSLGRRGRTHDKTGKAQCLRAFFDSGVGRLPRSHPRRV